MNITETITREILVDLYENQKFNQQQCADILKCGISKIQRLMKEFNIPRRTSSDWSKSNYIIQMTDEMYQILRGALLGDGSLGIGKGVNARFSYCSKSYQHVEYVTNKFSQYSNVGIYKSNYFDKRNENTYEKYSFNTKVSPVLTEEYYKWYKNGTKHIPNDLILTPLTCKIWYIGDGSLRDSQQSTSQEISFATNCFEKEELEMVLIPQLSTFEAKLYYDGYADAHIIKIGKKPNIIKFLNYIGECPFSDYQYKWNVIPAIGSGAGYSIKFDDVRELIYLYNLGINCNKIGKIYGLSGDAVSYWLKKNNVSIRSGKDSFMKKTLYEIKDELIDIDTNNMCEYQKTAIKKLINYCNQ